MAINDNRVQWLLEGEPWVKWRTYVHLLGFPIDSTESQLSHRDLIAHPLITQLISSIADWPNPNLNSHKASQNAYHVLSFLVDTGVNAADPGMAVLIEKILSHQSEQGPFQLKVNVSRSYGGSGKDEIGWALCDAPTVLYCLVKLLGGQDRRVRPGIKHLINLSRVNGWPCAVSPELGRWRGPGRKDDPCPYATLVMLKLLAELPEYSDSEEAHSGVETLLSLWENSLSQHPYIFYMGNDFRKIKAPLVWYDILHVSDVLSRFKWPRYDPRLKDMVHTISKKADSSGLYTPESIYLPWKLLDFGQKKEPSRYLTLRIMEIHQRLEMR